MFLLLYLCVMCVCRISIKITYLLTYTIPQQISAASILHFIFRIPHFTGTPGSGSKTLQRHTGKHQYHTE